MLKLLDEFFLAILAFYNKSYRLLFNIPALMAVLMGINIISILMIILPSLDDIISLIIWVSIPILIHTILCIIYNYDKRIHMIDRLKALPEAVVLKYKITLIVYSVVSVGLLFLSVYFSKHYTIDWNWLF